MNRCNILSAILAGAMLGLVRPIIPAGLPEQLPSQDLTSDYKWRPCSTRLSPQVFTFDPKAMNEAVRNTYTWSKLMASINRREI